MTTEQQLASIEVKLDALLELKEQIKDHINKDTLLFYGIDGTDGMVTDIKELKSSLRFYNKVLVVLGTFLAGVVGETIRGWFK